MNKLYKLLFKIMYLVYLLKTLVEYVCGLMGRKLRLFGFNQADLMNKILLQKNSIKKKPSNIVIAVGINKQQASEPKRHFRVISEKLQLYLSIIQLLGPQSKIKLFLQCQSNQMKNSLIDALKLNSDDKKANVDLINWGIIQNRQIEKQYLGSTPLVISFCEYSGICGLPYFLLQNSQISTCRPITESSIQDIFRSFHQYANSKQRNGK